MGPGALCKAEPELPKPHWADTRSGHTHTGKAEGDLSPQQSSRAGPALALSVGLPAVLPALAAGAGPVTGWQS